ncbi:hypothetical protein G6F56_000489 [Rhizopus delemar]|nr:hypothetical protein G6F56_000489 [Rhizopus delemar]
MKLFFIASSVYILYLMHIRYKATYDASLDTFRVEYLLVPSIVLGIATTSLYTVNEILWTFSIWLESVAILPQLFMLQKTGEAETITTHYLGALGAYRGLYILNWIYRSYLGEHIEWVSCVAGLLQTALYSDFFYIYYNKVLKGEKFELPKQIEHSQPEDVVQFCFDYFLSRLPQDSTPVHPNDLVPLESIKEDAPLDTTTDTFPIQNTTPPPFKATRRVSVSAESIQPKRLKSVHETPKAQSERDMIYSSLQSHFLFKTIEREQRYQVIEIMQPRSFVEGESVIEQGAAGDFFYVVSQGTLDCLVDGKRVERYGRGGSFGELALMYNAPRAASLIATSDGLLWALDRLAFRSVIMESNHTKRSLHTSFLQQVPLFQSLELAEIHKIADALETERFDDGQVVIEIGDLGDCFYLIEEGTAQCLDENMQKINQLDKGDYFGELALIHDRPRAATVVAEGALKCVTLSKLAFIRLLGPVMDILKRNTTHYHAVLRETVEE